MKGINPTEAYVYGPLIMGTIGLVMIMFKKPYWFIAFIVIQGLFVIITVTIEIIKEKRNGNDNKNRR